MDVRRLGPFRVALHLCLLVTVSCAPQARAALVCYDLWAYPAIGALKADGEGVRMLSIGRFRDEETGRAPVLKYHPDNGWTQSGHQECTHRECRRDSINKCALPPRSPDEDETKGDPGAKPERVYGVCTRRGDTRYLGISFYSGEGVTGTGGVARSSGENEVEIHRPGVLRHASVNVIAHDGRRLWLGTTSNSECVGKPPVNGLLHHQWEEQDSGPDKAEIHDANHLTCGFVFHDILLHNGSLWISNDMGVTRIPEPGSESPERFEHFVPTGNPENPVRKTGCEALYRDLAENLPRGDVEDHPLFQPYDYLIDSLEEIRPEFLRRHDELFEQENDGKSWH